MSKVLIIWQEIPENIKLYALEVDPATYASLCNCHGRYIGEDEFPEDEEWLSEWIMNKKPIYSGEGPPSKNDIILNMGKVTIIVTGFFL